MNKLENQKIYLKDYQVPNYLVDQVELTFKLSEEKTHVISKIFFHANPEATDSNFYLLRYEQKTQPLRLVDLDNR